MSTQPNATIPTAASSAPDTQSAARSTRLIVAGVDGSECSRHAAQWAADEAERLDMSLRLVRSYEIAIPSSIDLYPIPDLAESMRRAAAAHLDQLAGELRSSHPGLEVSTHLDFGNPVQVLENQSSGAYLTVVGVQGAGRLASVLLGSVALALASKNELPVAVIHEPAAAHPNGPVVIGIDGSPTSLTAVAFGFEWAAAHGAEVVALHVSWYESVADTTFPALRTMIDPDEVLAQEKALLTDHLKSFRLRYPAVVIREVIQRGRPAPLLLEYSREAQLVVVGSRGHGSFTGLLLGSTSQALITHSSCPVVVARPHA